MAQHAAAAAHRHLSPVTGAHARTSSRPTHSAHAGHLKTKATSIRNLNYNFTLVHFLSLVECCSLTFFNCKISLLLTQSSSPDNLPMMQILNLWEPRHDPLKTKESKGHLSVHLFVSLLKAHIRLFKLLHAIWGPSAESRTRPPGQRGILLTSSGPTSLSYQGHASFIGGSRTQAALASNSKAATSE